MNNTKTFHTQKDDAEASDRKRKDEKRREKIDRFMSIVAASLKFNTSSFIVNNFFFHSSRTVIQVGRGTNKR